MNLKGKVFHVDEVGSVSEEVISKLLDNEEIVINVSSLVKEEDADIVIEGTSLDLELLQPIPPMITLSENQDFAHSVTTKTPRDNALLEVTEAMLIEPVTNWFGEPIYGLFRVLQVSN